MPINPVWDDLPCEMRARRSVSYPPCRLLSPFPPILMPIASLPLLGIGKVTKIRERADMPSIEELNIKDTPEAAA